MIKVEKSVIVKKPVEKVFAYAQDMQNFPKWQDQGSMEMLEGSNNVVGSRYQEVFTFLGKEMKNIGEITAFKKNELWAAKVVEGQVPYETSMTYSEIPEGTKLTIVIEGEPKGFFKLAEGMVASLIEKDFGDSLNRLKTILESS